MDTGEFQYSDAKQIEEVVDTFKRLVSKLSKDGSELGDLYVRAERRATTYALLSETVVESATSGILVVEPSGELILANSAARRFLGITAREDLCGKRIGDLLNEPGSLEMLVRGGLRTGKNSSRNVVTVSTRDGVEHRIGASISCVKSSPSTVEAVIVVFGELAGSAEQPGSGDPTDAIEAERASYLRGVFDSYDLLTGVRTGVDTMESKAAGGTLTTSELKQFSEHIRRACDILMAFAVARGSDGAAAEIVDINRVIQSVIARRQRDLAGQITTEFCSQIPRVRSTRKILEMGLEMLLLGSAEHCKDGLGVATDLRRHGEVDAVEVSVQERGLTRPVVETGGSLREFAANRDMRRELGLFLLSSLPADSHRIAVERQDGNFRFSLTILLPIRNQAGPSTKKGDYSERSTDEG